MKTKPSWRTIFVRALSEDGHAVDIAGDGESGESLARGGAYDVIVLDRMLPKRNGVSVVENLREAGVSTPVLFLSALGEEDHRIEA